VATVSNENNRHGLVVPVAGGSTTAVATETVTGIVSPPRRIVVRGRWGSSESLIVMRSQLAFLGEARCAALLLLLASSARPSPRPRDDRRSSPAGRRVVDNRLDPEHPLGRPDGTNVQIELSRDAA
jgi:hypothetical protein